MGGVVREGEANAEDPESSGESGRPGHPEPRIGSLEAAFLRRDIGLGLPGLWIHYAAHDPRVPVNALSLACELVIRFDRNSD